jgi:hypothetical protein
VDVNPGIHSWNEAIKNRRYIFLLLGVIAAIVLVVSILPYYFHSVIGLRPGIRLNDPVLNLFSPQDHSWIIFGLIYLSLLIVLQGIRTKPLLILHGLLCYLSITVLRMVTMYVFTLEPPAGIIPLHDPIVDVIAYGGQVFNKDLFFSGHVATLTLFVLLEERRAMKLLLIANVLIVAGLILLQRVHYTIDVIAAPLLMFGVFNGIKRSNLIQMS